jgi:LmbE family N-acetylglucosaminyl deacetylase
MFRPLFACCFALVLTGGIGTCWASPSLVQCNGIKDLVFVPHEDDDLLFMNPDIASTIEAGGCVQVVYLTAAERGEGVTYMLGRERGVRAAYAYMAHAPNIWSEDFAVTGVRHLARFTLNGNKRIRLLHMRLKDPWLGKGWGSLTPLSQTESKPENTVESLGPAVERYSRLELVATIRQIIREYQPSTIRHLDDSITIPYAKMCWRCAGHDHPDHIASARLVRDAIAAEQGNYAEVAYVAYPTQERDTNLSASETNEKTEAFRRYAWNDYHYCPEGKLCQEPAGPAAAWVSRSYYVSRRNAPPVLLPGLKGGFSLFAAGEANGAANVWQSVGSHWTSLGGRTSDRITAFDCEDGQAGIFARDATGLVWANAHLAEGKWQGWQMVHGTRLTDLPLVSSQRPLLAVAMGNDGRFHYTGLVAGTENHWAAWRPLPPLPSVLAGIAMAADHAGERVIFAADSSGGLWLSVYTLDSAVWSAWHRLPVPATSGGLAAVRNVNGLIELYFRSKASGHMLRMAQESAGSAYGAWTNASDLGVAYIGMPAATLDEKGAVAVVALEHSGGALWLVEAGRATKLAEHVASMPAIGTINGTLYVAARSVDTAQVYWVRARSHDAWAAPIELKPLPAIGGGTFNAAQRHELAYAEPVKVSQ